MVSTKLLKLRVEMDIDIPMDLLESKNRLGLIEEGIIKSICKGLYEEGISFHIKTFNFHLDDNIKN
ncbi:MAG TPA: hypothetical protein VFV86_00725 [Nitrososphaeraceae archaeon]|nr:hypothetical protein [Nitrososphaeraceae archaeon]